MALAGACGLTSVVARLAGLLALGTHALRARLRELYQPGGAQRGAARSTFDAALCFGPLLRWAAGDHPNKRLVLALDPTNLTDRFRVLCAAVLYKGCSLPVAWAVQAAGQKGSWNDVWKDLLGKLAAELGAGWTVLVLTDRGLASPELFRAITALGWHPLMRVNAGGHFRPAGSRKGPPMGGLAAAAEAAGGRRSGGAAVGGDGGGGAVGGVGRGGGRTGGVARGAARPGGAGGRAVAADAGPAARRTAARGADRTPRLAGTKLGVRPAHGTDDER